MLGWLAAAIGNGARGKRSAEALASQTPCLGRFSEFPRLFSRGHTTILVLEFHGILAERRKYLRQTARRSGFNSLSRESQ
jgi:hypothetical protein